MSLQSFVGAAKEGFQIIWEVFEGMFGEVIHSGRTYVKRVIQQPMRKYPQLVLLLLWSVFTVLILWGVVIDPLLHGYSLKGETIWIARNGVFTLGFAENGLQSVPLEFSSCDPFTLARGDQVAVGVETPAPLVLSDGGCAVYYIVTDWFESGRINILEGGRPLVVQGVQDPPPPLAVQYASTTKSALISAAVSGLVIFLLSMVTWMLLAITDVVQQELLPMLLRRLGKQQSSD